MRAASELLAELRNCEPRSSSSVSFAFGGEALNLEQEATETTEGERGRFSVFRFLLLESVGPRLDRVCRFWTRAFAYRRQKIFRA